MKFKHVVISTDLSPASLMALEPAIQLAHDSEAKVTLLHVCEAFDALPHGAPMAPNIEAFDTHERVIAAKKELADWAKVHDAEASVHVIADDNVAEGVSKYVTEVGADLLAVATHGRTGWRHLILGSVAADILRRSPVPVIAFPLPKKG